MTTLSAPFLRWAFLFLLGLLVGCSKSDFERFREEAEKGDADAQVFVGNCYSLGNGVAKDIGQAMSWYRKAALNGHAQAQCDIGVRYLYGMGVAKDEIEAYAFFALAGPANEQARKNLAFLQNQMSSDVRLLGLKRKKELQEEMAASRAGKVVGGGQAERLDGQLSQSKSDSPKENSGKSIEVYRAEFEAYKAKAELQGDASAQYQLGVYYFNGYGVTVDVAESFKWYLKSAEQGYAGAQLALGGCYFAGKGVAKDEVEAYAYWSLAEFNYPAMFAGVVSQNEENISPNARILGKKRAKELQKEIEAKIAAKKAGK
jgi:TPR repeat protein